MRSSTSGTALGHDKGVISIGATEETKVACAQVNLQKVAQKRQTFIPGKDIISNMKFTLVESFLAVLGVVAFCGAVAAVIYLCWKGDSRPERILGRQRTTAMAWSTIEMNCDEGDILKIIANGREDSDIDRYLP
uniref:Cation_ATPase_N domain-containing protein n=1 Tax=Steinernema glaseri TaxID=37863 RepID=A0A1I7YJ86_9BILA